MQVEVLPENFITGKLIFRRVNKKYYTVYITVPPDLIRRLDLKDKDVISLAYLSKAQKPKTGEEQEK